MRSLRRVWLISALALVGAAVACTLNPQPLPPDTDFEPGNDAGAFGTRDSAPAQPDPSQNADAAGASSDSGLEDGTDAAPTPDADGGDAGDAGGDGGDGG